MKPVLRSILVLSFLLLSVVALASDAPAITEPLVEAHLAKDADGTHVHVSLGRKDVAELRVELFDERGTSIATYALRPEDGQSFGAVMSLAFAPAIGSKVASARITGISLRPLGGTETLFDKHLGAVPQSCAGQCNPTRIQCNNYCWCMGCVSATYSCTPESGCQAECNCLDCGSPPPDPWSC